MLVRLKNLFQKIMARGYDRELSDDYVRIPLAVPSADDDIDFSINPLDYLISPQELKSHMEQKNDIVLIDVREEWEYKKGHIENAIRLPFEELNQWIYKFDFDKEIVVYSHKGMWSMTVTYILQQIGYKNAKSLAGGIERWAIEIDKNIKRY